MLTRTEFGGYQALSSSPGLGSRSCSRNSEDEMWSPEVSNQLVVGMVEWKEQSKCRRRDGFGARDHSQSYPVLY